MTRRAILSFVVTAALLTTYAAGPASLAAEPISQSDVAPPTTPTTQQMPEITDAVGKFRHRDFEGALKMFREAAKKNPDLPPPYLLITQLFLQSNMLPAARNSLERTVMESPDDPQPYIFMGEIALRERRITEARLLYEKANSVLANYSAAAKRKTFLQSQIYNGLALTDEARENWADAKKELEEWLKIDSKNTMALQQLAQCQFQLKNVQGALDRLNEAVKIDSKILTPEATIAQFYAQAGDKENARKWIIAALTKAPMDIETRLVAAQWAWETEQFDEAKRQAKAALQLDAKSLKAMLLCGLVALFQKDYPTAELYFESAHRKSPKDFAASNNLALALAEQKDEAKRHRRWSMPKSMSDNIRKWRMPIQPMVGYSTNSIGSKRPRTRCAKRSPETSPPRRPITWLAFWPLAAGEMRMSGSSSKARWGPNRLSPRKRRRKQCWIS